jgi:hypothetical protein
MVSFLAEDIRNILNKLDEYITNLDEAGDDKPEAGKTEDGKSDDTQGEPVDATLTKPAGLEKIAGSINVQALVELLEIPEEEVAHFKAAIDALRQEDPTLTTAQAHALAIAFNHIITHRKDSKGKIFGVLRSTEKGVEEDLDPNRIKGYMAQDQAKASKPGNDISQMKDMINAVKNHGTRDEKDQLGLTEDQVEIIGYNSGHGENLDVVARDPKRHRKVEMIQLRMGAQGQPELVFRDTDGDKYTAEWNSKYGWVADFD